ncbi:hypothetical protein R3P38DRAFT_3219565 [Favolaschia claudopus]|uniref:Uncharacterized protein n=1 Tax=Favolaschia claudopus TaxID=2862362 RepID=A0AAW0A1S7_9AGAR
MHEDDTIMDAATSPENDAVDALPNDAVDDPAPPPQVEPEPKRALWYEVDSTSTISFLPPVQKGRLVQGWRRRHLEHEHPERAQARVDDEVEARIGASYDISCMYLQMAHAEALFKAEERAREKNFSDFDDDSDDDGNEAEELKPQDIIVWDGTRPELIAHRSTDAGPVADTAVAADIDDDMGEDGRTGQAMAVRSLLTNSGGERGFFNFVPASLLDSVTEDIDAESERDAAPSPIPSLISQPGSDIDDVCKEEEKESAEIPAARATHVLELVNVNGVRKVMCGCEDGKHMEQRSRQTFAFEAHNGTVIVKKLRSLRALNTPVRCESNRPRTAPLAVPLSGTVRKPPDGKPNRLHRRPVACLVPFQPQSISSSQQSTPPSSFSAHTNDFIRLDAYPTPLNAAHVPPGVDDAPENMPGY